MYSWKINQLRGTMSPKQLTLEDVYGSDPMARILFERMNIKPLVAALFFIVTGVIYTFILPRLWGYPFEIDAVNLILINLVFPVAAYFYVYQPKSILRVYNSANRFFREEDSDLKLPFEGVIKWHARRVWWVIGLCLGLLGAWFGTTYSADHFQEYWYSANWFEIIFVQSVRFLAFYAIGLSATRHIATSMALNNLFEHAQFPLTLDTDRLEVFSSVKKFALEFVGVSAIIGLILGLQPLLVVLPMPEYAVYVGLYFIVTPICFFLPLWEAHRRMSAIKNKMLDKLHSDFQEESYNLYDITAKDLKKDSSNRYLKKSQTLTSIKQAIELVNQAHDWPFEGTTFYQLLITVISPFILAILDGIVNMVTSFFSIK
jgi:hypothetical protein